MILIRILTMAVPAHPQIARQIGKIMLKLQVTESTKVDTKTFDFHTETDLDEDEENELETNSVSSKTSFHVGDVLPEPNQHSSDHSSVHAVASESSINSSEGCVERPSLLKQLSRGHSIHLHSPASPDKPFPSLLTSARDALGYATLKDIQRRRVNSLSFHDSSSNQVDVSLRYLKSQSLDADAAKAHVTSDLLFSEPEDNSIKFQSLNQEPESYVLDNRFIGLCLPSNLDFLLYVPKQSNDSEEFIATEPEAAPSSKDSVFEFHSEENESEEHCTVTVKPVEDNLYKKFLPLERSNSIKGLLKYKDDSNSQYLIRKEAMHYVTNLCSSVAVKASEQGLLNLKQKFPSSFQDICLYSEISYYMANYNFRLNARRFLQELFLDVAFEQLQMEAEAVVGIISIPQIGGSEV
ncbi:rapamycin-insensitive companion of mTOR [Caerostris extrusa]|uniref:Rapamycin-insensitive companion of mTOR n=1 Tax=Caerostris extrusa TaxID=172846 RepID=A0AAV4N9K2_CAEEX|nr:rapamycin-insensitive companion of mTOR [Caerostris extrusa]